MRNAFLIYIYILKISLCATVQLQERGSCKVYFRSTPQHTTDTTNCTQTRSHTRDLAGGSRFLAGCQRRTMVYAPGLQYLEVAYTFAYRYRRFLERQSYTPDTPPIHSRILIPDPGFCLGIGVTKPRPSPFRITASPSVACAVELQPQITSPSVTAPARAPSP